MAGPGKDTLAGGAGKGSLTGGHSQGADFSFFDSALDAKKNLDKVIDFEHGADKIAKLNLSLLELPR